MQPNGSSVYRLFMDSGVLPTQTPALGLAGGLDVPGYLGDGGQVTSPLAGLHLDDAHNNMTVSGYPASALSQADGSGPGRGQGASSSIGSGGGGYGTAGGSGENYSLTNRSGKGGDTVSIAGIWECLRLNSFTREVLGHGSSGGTGGIGSRNDSSAGGDALIQVVHGTLTTVARDLSGHDGRVPSSEGPGGGAGGLWLGIANSIVYGNGTINVSGGSGVNSGGEDGGNGGNGRVVQVYFDAKADNLQVTGGVQDQFRILRSVPIGQNTFL